MPVLFLVGLTIGFGASSLRLQWPVRKQVDLINVVQSNRHGFPVVSALPTEGILLLILFSDAVYDIN